MGCLFHFEREDDIEEMYGLGRRDVRYVAVPDDIIAALAEHARAIGMAFVCENGNTSIDGVTVKIARNDQFNEYRVAFNHAEDELKGEFICSLGSGCLYIFRKGLTKEEFLKLTDYPSEPEKIIKRLNTPYSARNLKVVIIPREEAVSDVQKIGYINEAGKLGFKKHKREVFSIAGYDAPYVVSAEYDLIEDCSWKPMWWYPVNDSIDMKYFNTSILKEHNLDGMEMPATPSEDNLNRNTAAYTAAMVAKIEESIQNIGFYDSAKDDSKAVFWRENFLPEEYGVINFHRIVRKDTDIFKVAAVLGYEKNLSCQAKDSGVTVEIAKNGIKVTRICCKDIFEGWTYGNDKFFRNKCWYTETTEYTASKTAIMALFKKHSIDPYEVTKLTTVWHYIGFANAITEALKLGDVSLNGTELSLIKFFGEADASYFKKNFTKACERYCLRDDTFIGLMGSIKKVAEKLGVPCRDPAATYKAAADHAASRRR